MAINNRFADLGLIKNDIKKVLTPYLNSVISQSHLRSLLPVVAPNNSTFRFCPAPRSIVIEICNNCINKDKCKYNDFLEIKLSQERAKTDVPFCSMWRQKDISTVNAIADNNTSDLVIDPKWGNLGISDLDADNQWDKILNDPAGTQAVDSIDDVDNEQHENLRMHFIKKTCRYCTMYVECSIYGFSHIRIAKDIDVGSIVPYCSEWAGKSDFSK